MEYESVEEELIAAVRKLLEHRADQHQRASAAPREQRGEQRIPVFTALQWIERELASPATGITTLLLPEGVPMR